MEVVKRMKLPTIKHAPMPVFPKAFLSEDPFWPRKLNTDRPCSRQYSVRMHPKLKFRISELILYIYTHTHTHIHILIHTSGILYNAFHDMALIKMTVARLVGTGGFLNRYSIGHIEINVSPVKKVAGLFFNEPTFH